MFPQQPHLPPSAAAAGITTSGRLPAYIGGVGCSAYTSATTPSPLCSCCYYYLQSTASMHWRGWLKSLFPQLPHLLPPSAPFLFKLQSWRYIHLRCNDRPKRRCEKCLVIGVGVSLVWSVLPCAVTAFLSRPTSIQNLVQNMHIHLYIYLHILDIMIWPHSIV